MLEKNNQSSRKFRIGIVSLSAVILFAGTEILGQVRSVPPSAPVKTSTDDYTWWYVSLFILAIGLAGAVYWWLNSKKERAALNSKTKPAAKDSAERGSLDGDKELEWLRKNQKLVGRKTEKKKAPKKRSNDLPNTAVAVPRPAEAERETITPNAGEKNSSVLPIFSINRLELARPFDALPISDDENLLNAVEQSYDEFEEDEEVRELAVRILAAFRKQNAVEALSQIALYDLSSNLRSKAVTVLSEFDHESVFETILLASADPTREVRAAAARSLTKLTFDRADAWTRIAEVGEEGRVKQAARAAIESGFVDMSFDRLASPDHKQAYEAFTLMALLIEAGEIEKIFEKLETHFNMNVRRAILHTLKITKNSEALDKLHALSEENKLPAELQEEVQRTVEELELVAA